MDGASTTLSAAIEGLYRVFEGYPLRPSTEPCMHCHTEEEEQRVHRRPLRELLPEDLAGFAADSLMTWGDVVDFKHCLPRLFEILTAGGFPDDYPDMETVVGALARGHWHDWPSSEQAGVATYLRSLCSHI